MKKLMLLACLLLVGCGNNVDIVEPPIVTIDGEVIYKYEVDVFLFKDNEYHLVAEVEYPQEQTYDMKVSEYVYNYYEIGDTIQFALKG